MKITKLIIIRYMPLTDIIYHKFYLDRVIELGIDIEYWDITNIFFQKTDYLEASFNNCKIIKLNSYKELIKNLKLLDMQTTLFFPIMSVEGRVRKLYKIFTKHSCRLMIFGRNMFPSLPHNSSMNSIYKRIRSITLKKIINKLNSILLRREIFGGKIIPFEVVFLGGNYGWAGIGTHNMESLKKSHSIVKLNSEDYDRACKIKAKNTPSSIEGKYILFLDEYLPLHPDTLMFDIKNVDSDRYYEQLNIYFDKIEAQFGIPVVIAAHPKAQKYRERNYFNGRVVRFGESAILCKDAQYVVTHDSTSINFAICFGKPLLLITSHEIENTISFVHEDVLHFANIIGCNWQYFDDLEAEITIKPIDHAKYEAFKYNFQTWEETENKDSEDIFINYLKNNM